MSKTNSPDIVISSKITFNIDVSYKVIETGPKGEQKPLITYLHGFKDTLQSFKQTCDPVQKKLSAYHLFIEGPYPIYNQSGQRKIKDWRRAWYIYDGDPDHFIESLERSSKFLENTIDNVKKKIKIVRHCIFGYSMGGYLAGYFAMTRPEYVNDLIVVGARIKTEVLKEKWEQIKDLQVLAIHGERDSIVDYKPQRHEVKRLIKHGIQADFKLIDQKHVLNSDVFKIVCEWLLKKDYFLY